MRTLRMGGYGTLVFGPFCAFWYTKWLPAMVPMTEPALKPVLQKVFLDETLQSWFYYLSFPYTMTMFEGHGHDAAVAKIKKDFWTCYTTDLMIWPWVQFLNF